MSEETDGAMFTIESARRIDRAVSSIEHSTLLRLSSRMPIVPPQGIWYWGKLTSALTAGSLAAPTTATVNAWVTDGTSASNPKPFIVTTDATLLGLTVVNRSNMTGSSGAMVKIEYGWGEWSFKWADC